MKRTSHRAVRQGLPAAVAAGALAAALAGPVGSVGGQEPAPEPAEITMELEGERPQFRGSEQVTAGQELRIVNNTAVRRIGPHTFTLATRRVLPSSRRAIQRCFRPGRVCLRTAIAHEFNERTGAVGRKLVEVGDEGWDRSFSRNRTKRGDTWYTQKKGGELSQVVSAPAGTTLRFICVIHPAMQGKIEVVAAPE